MGVAPGAHSDDPSDACGKGGSPRIVDAGAPDRSDIASGVVRQDATEDHAMARTDASMAHRLRKTRPAEGGERAAAGADSNVVVIPVRLRQSQLRLLQIAAEGATKRLGQQVSVSTVIAALITKYRSELAAEVEATPESD
jgi:hypothetical protein